MTYPRVAVAIAVVVAALLAACNTLIPAGTASSPPGVSAPPAGSAAPGGSPAPTESPIVKGSFPVSSPLPSGAVTSPAQAAALVFASDEKFGSIPGQGAGAVGRSAFYDAFDTGNGYGVTITMGSGDCLSSCINTHTWTYSVSRDGTIKLVTDQGDPVEITIDHGTADPATVTIRLVAGPVCPVERNPPDPSCAPRPVPDAEIVVHDATGAEVARGTASTDGTFTTTLPGGAYYAESAAVTGLMGQAAPVAFSVPGGRAVTVTMEYDTGIR